MRSDVDRMRRRTSTSAIAITTATIAMLLRLGSTFYFLLFPPLLPLSLLFFRPPFHFLSSCLSRNHCLRLLPLHRNLPTKVTENCPHCGGRGDYSCMQCHGSKNGCKRCYGGRATCTVCKVILFFNLITFHLLTSLLSRSYH